MVEIFIVLYFVIGISFALAAEVRTNREITVWMYVQSMFAWPIFWIITFAVIYRNRNDMT